MFINQCYDELNLKAPDLVRDVHATYAKAGAEVLETNTFGANRVKLSQYGLETQVREINRAAARIAREVAGDDHLVAGAVGPLGVRIEPYGPTSVEEAFQAFREQMTALKEGGVDCFLLETFGDLAEIAQASARGARGRSDDAGHRADDDRRRRPHAVRRERRKIWRARSTRSAPTSSGSTARSGRRRFSRRSRRWRRRRGGS